MSLFTSRYNVLGCQGYLQPGETASYQVPAFTGSCSIDLIAEPIIFCPSILAFRHEEDLDFHVLPFHA